MLEKLGPKGFLAKWVLEELREAEQDIRNANRKSDLKFPGSSAIKNFAFWYLPLLQRETNQKQPFRKGS